MQPNENLDENETPIFFDLKKIIERDDATLLKEALNSYPQLIDIQNSNQRSLAHEAAEGGSWGCLSVLRDMGGDINAKDIYAQTPLHRALARHREEASLWLIENGADLNCRDFYGNTAVLFAAEWRSDILEKIIEEGGDPDTVDKMGRGVGEWAKMGADKAVKTAQARKILRS